MIAGDYYEYKKIWIIKKKELLGYLKVQELKGYVSYLDVNEINSLINKVSAWYDLKYPNYELAKLDINNFKLEDMNILSQYMNSDELFKRLSFLNDPRRSELVLFFVLLMPLTPKDAILYIVPVTKIRFKNFLIINAIARIPSILTSTIAGDVLLDGNYVVTIIIYVVNFVFALLCIIFNKQIIDFFDRIRNKNKTENDKIEKN